MLATSFCIAFALLSLLHLVLPTLLYNKKNTTTSLIKYLIKVAVLQTVRLWSVKNKLKIHSFCIVNKEE